MKCSVIFYNFTGQIKKNKQKIFIRYSEGLPGQIFICYIRYPVYRDPLYRGHTVFVVAAIVPPSSTRSHRVLTIVKKHDILKKIDEGLTFRRCCEHYDLP